MKPTQLLLALALVVALLTATAERGPFTVDDNNYLATLLALRSGSWFLPGTADQPPSVEWYAFDPFPELKGPPRTPIVATAPPWWAVLALPFSVLGLRGFVLLNALAFALCLLCVHQLVAMHVTRRAALFATLTLGLGSFALEYAQSIWPHMLSLGLVSAAIYFAAVARREGAWKCAAAAGFLAAVAAGVRYQNVVVAAAIGVGLVFATRRRILLCAAFALAAAVPLIAATFVNAARIGVANPVTKGSGYARLAVVAQPGPASSRLSDAALSLYTRVIDYSVHGPITDGKERWRWERDPDLGAFIAAGAVKKALLQSVPWFALALGLLAGAWLPSAWGGDARRRAELRALSLVPLALLAMFAAAGASQHDGFCFNQRYFFEALPAAAFALAIYFEAFHPGTRRVLIGGLCGLVLALPLALAEPGSILRTDWIRFAPLALGSAVVLAALIKRTRSVGTMLVCAAVTYALAVHVSDDLPVSRRIKRGNGERLAELEQALPSPAALFAFAGARDAIFAVTLGADVWVFDLWLDRGKDGPMLILNALKQGRRVFLDQSVPSSEIERLVRATRTRAELRPGKLLELLPVEN